MAYHQRTIINYHYLADWCMTWILFCCLVAKSWTILCSPMDCSPSGSSVHGILQPMDCSQQEFFSKQEYQSGLPFPSPGYLPNPGIKPRSPALQVDSLPIEPPRKPVCVCVCVCVYKTPFLLLYLWFWKSYPFFKICLIHYLLQFLPIKRTPINSALKYTLIKNPLYYS